MAAGKFGSQSVFLLSNGVSLIAAKLKSLSYKITAPQEDTTGLGDSWREFTPVGIGQVDLTVGEGLFDTTASTGSHAVLSGGIATTVQATPRVVCLGVAGDTAGYEFVGFEGTFQSSYDVLAQVGQLTKANAEYVIKGRFERGQIVQPLAVQTGDWSTDTANTEIDYTLDTTQRVIPITSNSQANPTVINTPVPHGLATNDIVLIAGVSGSSPDINGERTVTVISTTTFSVAVNTSAGTGGTGGSFVRSNTIGGAVGFLQVTACSGFTNFVGKIRDSADNSTYADLITFADNVSAPFAERVTTTGTIDRYLTFDGNITGSGSITAWAGLCRL
jgi:hypothetical protein